MVARHRLVRRLQEAVAERYQLPAWTTESSPCTSMPTAAVAHRIAAGGVAAGAVLAVTFTEMSSRIPAALDGGPASSSIGTFHGLAARQLRIEPEIAGLRPGFDTLDADDSRRIVRRTLNALNLASGDGGRRMAAIR